MESHRAKLFGDREVVLAVVYAVSKFYQYLHGKPFVIESDHQPLKYLNTTYNLNERLIRWSMNMQSSITPLRTFRVARM